MFNLPKMEEEVLHFWEETDAYKESLNPKNPTWRLLDGPPTMNGTPGVHHVEARAFKDFFGRFKTMEGFYVPRRAGWDCHGLPVEVSVLKELGLNGPEDVNKYSVEAFNRRCRESVLRHQEVFEKLTKRMGYWCSVEDAWRTMDASYTETLWAALKELHQKKLLVKDRRVTPWCPNCMTGLSSHEVATGTRERNDQSVTVAFNVPSLDAKLLVWTTTPWTLAENMLVGVDPQGSYKLLQTSHGKLLVSVNYPVDGEVLKTYQGSELNGTVYTPALPKMSQEKNAYQMKTAAFVNSEAGTGFVHLAPAYGRDDFALAKTLGLEVTPLLEKNGTFTEGPFKGLHTWEVTSETLNDLGVEVFAEETVTHPKGHCWRCETPLVELARPSWFLLASTKREEMLTQVENTLWRPGENRFKRWVETNVDWALTRERFWGTPLPVWECGNGHQEVVGSREELSEKTGENLQELDLHRPYVDEVTWECKCGETMVRHQEVLDTWFDSGAAPLVLGEETWDLVAEGADQTRGWFYTLSALSALLGKKQPFKEVLSLGLVLDQNGAKMSKSAGNVVDPFELFEKHGADAVRWTLLVDGNSWSERRFSETSVETSARLLSKLWACTQLGFTDTEDELESLEYWMEGVYLHTLEEMNKELKNSQVGKAGAALERLVETFSTKYLRARRGSLGRKRGAFTRQMLNNMSKLFAPFTPHFAEKLYWETGGVGSVHHQSWPQLHPGSEHDFQEGERMWALVEAGRAQRAKLGQRLRQPLLEVTFNTEPLEASFQEVLKTQLNVKTVSFKRSQAKVRPNWKQLGAEFTKDAKTVAKLLLTAESTKVKVSLNGEELTLEAPKHYQFEESELVTFDSTMTEALKREGDVADLVRKVVEARKSSGYKAEDHVRVKFLNPNDQETAQHAKAALLEKNTETHENGELTLS